MISLNDGWMFSKNNIQYYPVEIPHDWLIYNVKNLYESGMGYYKRELDLSYIEDRQRVFLHFDGVYMDTTLYVNDCMVGEWKYGYTAFEFDITDYIKKNSINIILVKVNYVSPNARWYTGAGIYRNVFLKIKNPYYIINDGIYITTYKKEGQWCYEVDAEVFTDGKPYSIKHHILEKADNYKSWDIHNPNLYTLRSTLIVDGTVMDTLDTRFGFRTLSYTVDKGFYLNDNYVKLKGVCLHHDLGSLGAAVHRDAIYRQLLLLKDMGVNAIRTAHNPPAKVFMELTDEMGFLVMSELLDIWEHPKNTYDYSRFFKEWVEKDVASWIRRDRNHPSIIMWSVGNEIYDTHKDKELGKKTLKYLMDLVEKHDPKKHAPITLCSNYMPWENTQECADLIKLVGYNYGESLYEDHHKKYSDWIIYGSETCSTVSSRGIYHFPLHKSILADDDLQCSSLGNSATSWGAKSVEACIKKDFDTNYSLGQFIWSGFDYLGEPTPYHTKNSYLGQIDTAGFPKDSYYIFKAYWTDYKISPMVHLFPYWDFSPGQIIDVRVCSNAKWVELFLNQKSLGLRELNDIRVTDWQIPYEPGVLEVYAYDEDKKVIATDIRKSFGDVATLNLDYTIFGELLFVTITAYDIDNNPVENANQRVIVEVGSDGELIALDNGDATDYDEYYSNNKRLFSGKLLAIIKIKDGIIPSVKAHIDTLDIPIRKIELIKQDSSIHARIYPPNASYQDLYWRLTDANGIDSPLGILKLNGDATKATLIPKGDGEVYIRCQAKNGREHISLITAICHTIKGYGKSFLDPYSFISGGLYTNSNVELTNGNERGVATLRNKESHVGFEQVDFGNYGSNIITLELFPLENNPFYFEVWEGDPLIGGKHITNLYYDKGSIWNTYQAASYELPHRFKGVTSIYFVFRQKVHIKGFQFTKLDKAFQKLYAVDCDLIYGDSFMMGQEAIFNIGNNVSLIYKHMDFKDSKVNKLLIRCRSSHGKNSIKLIFHDEYEEVIQMVDVVNSDDFEEYEFTLHTPITGDKNLSFIFLPGCNLDLEWIQLLT